MRGFFVQLLVEHGGGLFVGHGNASFNNYLVVIINQMVIINYHRVFLLSRKERISKIKDTALWPDKAEELGFDFKPILKQQ